MKISRSLFNYTSALCTLMFAVPAVPAMSICLDTVVQLQILGPGGPSASGGRASSGYLLWVVRIPVIPIIDSGFIRSPDLPNAPSPIVSL
jgi:hypothetical protein